MCFEGLARLSRWVWRHFVRGSREISLVPSLHRASTDALIRNFSFGIFTVQGMILILHNSHLKRNEKPMNIDYRWTETASRNSDSWRARGSPLPCIGNSWRARGSPFPCIGNSWRARGSPFPCIGNSRRARGSPFPCIGNCWRAKGLPLPCIGNCWRARGSPFPCIGNSRRARGSPSHTDSSFEAASDIGDCQTARDTPLSMLCSA